MLADLHTHTTASDGGLAPLDLRRAAAAAGVTLLAVTDHDTTAAYAELEAEPATGPALLHGIEFSTWWQRHGIHVLGLNIDIRCDSMRQACAYQSNARITRAMDIANHLEKRGVTGAYAGATAFADGGALGRPHFARYLVSVGAVATPAQAFKKYLGAKHLAGGFDHWAPMPTIIDWIRAAGGTAVLAHPAKYKLTRSRLGALTREFCAAGGGALEVISGQQQAHVTTLLSDLARRHNLSASLGSDFHHPGLSWAALGRCPALPDDLTPVWDTW